MEKTKVNSQHLIIALTFCVDAFAHKTDEGLIKEVKQDLEAFVGVLAVPPSEQSEQMLNLQEKGHIALALRQILDKFDSFGADDFAWEDLKFFPDK